MSPARAEAPILVVGFGPFLDVRDNPAARLALGVDGADIGGVPVIGREIPVSYERGVQETLALVGQTRPRAVVGLGLAVKRTCVSVERWGRNRAASSMEDVDGARLSVLEVDGPERAGSTAPVEALARALGALVSEDAGGYVCNAWLYRVVRALGAPGAPEVVFVHLPWEGLAPSRFRVALTELWSSPSTRSSPQETPSPE